MPAVLTLAHSPDPDDAFMWWPLTGKVEPPREPPLKDWTDSASVKHARQISPAPLDTKGFTFAALPADIEVLNRRAVMKGDLDITALSVRTYADVQHKYAITACGASFGDGFGPKVVVRVTTKNIRCEGCLARPEVRIAIPGRRTTAFLMLGMILGKDAAASVTKFVELPFDQIISAVARGEVDAGLVIHEGQLTFGDAGLRLIIDVGEWWKEKTGLKLPLGINAVRRDLDERYGKGTLATVGGLLKESVAYSMARWNESVAYTLPFAEENVRRGGGQPPTMERLERYCRMYVSEETRDMGDAGREAIRRLLSEGAAAGLCPAVSSIDLV